jgi:capsular polysaccharide biosynthesis protein
MENKTNEMYTIDLGHIMKTLLHRVWLIALAALLAGAIGFSISAFFITPTYSSSVKLYVNNRLLTTEDKDYNNITPSDITAAQNLVKTYGEILDNRTTMEMVNEKIGGSYTYRELDEMITSKPVNETEIMEVIVTTTDPYESARIANAIAEVLPIRITRIIDGATMEVVDYAVPELDKVAPSITKYTALGLILGALAAIVALVIAALLDDTIHDEDYILQNYDCPILAKVPDLLDSGSKRYGYYYQNTGASQNNKKGGR